MMFERIKRSLETEEFQLAEVQARLDVFLAQGEITHEQWEQLRQMAQEIFIEKSSEDIASKMREFERKLKKENV